jgi:hypothetical protein
MSIITKYKTMASTVDVKTLPYITTNRKHNVKIFKPIKLRYIRL